MLRHRPKGSKMPITGRHSGYICLMMEGSWLQATDVTRPWWMTTSIIHSYESKWHLPGPHKHCWVAHARYQEETESHLFLQCVYQITYFKPSEQAFKLCNYTSFGNGDKLVPNSVSNSTQPGPAGSILQYLCPLDDKGQPLNQIPGGFEKTAFCPADIIQRSCIACPETPEQISNSEESSVALFFSSSLHLLTTLMYHERITSRKMLACATYYVWN